MLILQKRSFFYGALLLISFAFMFWLMLYPLFPGQNGQKITSLEYADKIFNQLSKGSSWFIPKVREKLLEIKDSPVNMTVRFQNQDNAILAQALLNNAGAKSELADGKIHFQGNLATILMHATEDATLLYQNNGEELSARYGGANALAIARAWWHLLTPCIKELQKEKKNKLARMVDEVIRRAIEPGNNFYGIEAENVADNIITLAAFMLFYILYTLWYGFAIYEIFKGLGLMTSETRAKEELEEEREEGVGE